MKHDRGILTHMGTIIASFHCSVQFVGVFMLLLWRKYCAESKKKKFKLMCIQAKLFMAFWLIIIHCREILLPQMHVTRALQVTINAMYFIGNLQNGFIVGFVIYFSFSTKYIVNVSH